MSCWSYGYLRRAIWDVLTDASEEPIASIFRLEVTEDGGNRSSETLVNSSKITLHKNPEGQRLILQPVIL
jgi:hypothetical protein